MKEKIITVCIFLSIFGSFFYFGLPRIANFSGVDEPYWSYGRVPNFWNAIKNGQWKKTNICDKPGITIAAVSGIGLPFIDGNPKNLKSIRYEAKTPQQLQKINDLYFYLRLPVMLFTMAILPLFYFLIKKLLGKNTARIALIFIGLSPVLLGISLIINADAMLWIMTALSTLSLFVFLKDNQRKFLLLSGFFLGLSVIDKYVANILFVYFFLVFFLEYIFFAHGKVEIGKYLKSALLNYLILFATAMATAFVFFPATWVKLSVLFNATLGNAVFSSTWPLFVGAIGLIALDVLAFKTKFSKIIFGFLADRKNLLMKIVAGVFLMLIAIVFLHVYMGVKIYDLQALIASPKGIGQDLDSVDASLKTIVSSSKGGGIIMTAYTYLGAILADVYSMLFSISPLVLVFLLFSVSSLFRKKEMHRDSLTVIYIIMFLLLFYLGSTVNNVITTVRYQIMTYPLIFVLAAIGAQQFLTIEKVKKYFQTPFTYAIFIVILFASLFFVRPDYLAYASEILPNNFIVNLKGMGEGSVEAATYLNGLAGAHDMTIWADKGAVCERFVGRCYIDFKQKTFTENKIDYFVVSTDRKSRTLKLSGSAKKIANFAKAYSSQNNAFEVLVDNNPNNFVKVIKGEEILTNNAQ